MSATEGKKQKGAILLQLCNQLCNKQIDLMWFLSSGATEEEKQKLQLNFANKHKCLQQIFAASDFLCPQATDFLCWKADPHFAAAAAATASLYDFQKIFF